MMLGFGNPYPESTEETELIRKSRFGIGTKRTLKQAEEFSGINFRKKKMDVNRCGNLIWVPYEESPDYGLAETLSRPNTDEEVVPFVVTPDSPPFFKDEVISMSETVHIAESDYRFVAGVVLVAIALVLKVRTQKRKKDDSHKE